MIKKHHVASRMFRLILTACLLILLSSCASIVDESRLETRDRPSNIPWNEKAEWEGQILNTPFQ